MNTKSLLLAGVIGIASTPMLAIAADDGERSTLEQAGDYVSDAALTTRVNAAFAAESELSALDISVESSDGTVTLTGDVDSEAQVSLAERVAKDIDGVKSVHNELKASDS